MIANNSNNNNVMFFFCFRFENNIRYQLLILDYDAWDKRRKYFCHYLLEDKIIQNCFKIDATN